jgi:hypothetical protein
MKKQTKFPDGHLEGLQAGVTEDAISAEFAAYNAENRARKST